MSRRKTERLLSLVVCLLSARRYLTASQIRDAVPGYPESFDAFKRMFERDKDELRELGIPLETGISATADEEPVSAEPASSEPVPERVKRARVLVVDDEIQIANTLRELLSIEHEVTATTSAREALSIVRGGNDFDVIFCDLMMPQMSGMELHAELMRLVPDQAHKMIFMTGGAFSEEAASFLTKVSNPTVEKPFKTTALRELVRNQMP